MLRNGSQSAKTVSCLCKQEIPEADALEHSRNCFHFKAVFGALSDALTRAIDGVHDSSLLAPLCAVLSNARTMCKQKIKEKGKLQVPFYPKM